MSQLRERSNSADKTVTLEECEESFIEYKRLEKDEEAESKNSEETQELEKLFVSPKIMLRSICLT